MSTTEAPFVDIRGLTVTFTAGRKPVRAVDGVDLQVRRGEVVALIGESGSGKSVTLRSLLRLHTPRHTQMGGQMRVGEHDVLALSPGALADYRGRVASMIFQEPLLALDPVYTVGAQIVESIRRHENVSAAQAQQRALELFERVRIPSPERRLQAYPHEMSGGMRQRAMIALALACRPQLRELQRDLGLAVVFVTHDIGAAVEVADRIAVMYAGRIVEEGPARTLIREPRHPYTLALLRSRAHGALAKGSRLETIGGAPPDLSALPPGCAFAERCAWAQDACRQSAPEPVVLAPGHQARCLRTEATAPTVSKPAPH